MGNRISDIRRRLWFCSDCGKSYESKWALDRHFRKKHMQVIVPSLVNKMGRPTVYKPEYADQLVEWFSGIKYERQVIETTKRYSPKTGKLIFESEKVKYVASDLPTLAGFARHIAVRYETLWDWATAVEDENADTKKLKHADFSNAYNIAKSMQKEFLIDNALKGHYPPASFIFTAKNITDMTDKQIIETEDKNYKEKKDVLNAWFDTIRHHAKSRPGSPGTDAPAS
jgi:hypothetical protein